MTYDNWKTTNPEDEALGVYESYADCDCCGKLRRLRQCWVYGNMETWACAECRQDDDDDSDRVAFETGEQT